MKKKTKKRVEGTTWKGQMPLTNIHLNKGTYPHSGVEPVHFNSISNINYISQVYADKYKQ